MRGDGYEINLKPQPNIYFLMNSLKDFLIFKNNPFLSEGIRRDNCLKGTFYSFNPLFLGYKQGYKAIVVSYID